MAERQYQLPEDIVPWRAQRLLGKIQDLPFLFFNATLSNNGVNTPTVLTVQSSLGPQDIDIKMMEMIRAVRREEPPRIILG